MRAFVAVELSPGAREVIMRGMGELRRRLGQARWVRAEGLHITMRFLGEQSGELLEHLAADAAAALAAETPVEVALGGGGFFPHEQRPRVAWLGGVAPGMERWAAAIEHCAVAAGLEPEPRAFTPHVTLARLDRPWGAGDVETFRVAVGKWRLAPYVAREVVLFSSELRPSGAVYTPLRRVAVGAHVGGAG
jgi:2'-5' RNA ligase